MSLSFIKMTASGNDFIVIDGQRDPFAPSSQDIEFLCHRRLGIGADQLLLIEPSAQTHGKMRIFNANGLEVEQCGNGARCVAYYLAQKINQSRITLETKAGIHPAVIEDSQSVSINLGKPSALHPMELDYEDLNQPLFVNMGNPHLIFYVPKVEEIDVETLGSYFEKHPLFPQGTNVHFVETLSSKHIKMKVWERGVGITWACGSGACAAVAAGLYFQNLKGPLISITFDHETLSVSSEADGSLCLKGPVHWVFSGTIDLDPLKRKDAP